jgi:hypothetical protein
VFGEAGFEVERVERPSAHGEEEIEWRTEPFVPPWAIYIVRKVRA